MFNKNHAIIISLKSEVAEMKEKSRMSGGRYIQNQQLEELRTRQDNLTKEQNQWKLSKEKIEKDAKAEEEHMQEKRVRVNTSTCKYLHD